MYEIVSGVHSSECICDQCIPDERVRNAHTFVRQLLEEDSTYTTQEMMYALSYHGYEHTLWEVQCMMTTNG